MNIRSFIKRTAPLALAFVLGLAMIRDVGVIASYQDKQSMYYDAAIQALSKQDAQTAASAFQASINAFKGAQAEQSSFVARIFLPAPDQELAALAYFQLGNILAGQDPEKALGAYVMSLRLNNGQVLIQGASARDDDLHQYGKDYCVYDPSNRVAMAAPVTGEICQLRRLEKEAQDTRNNIQALVDQHPELQKMLANGGKIGSGDQGNQPMDGKKGEMPSQGNPGGQGFTHNNPSQI